MTSQKLSWPYPDTKHELVQVVMSTLAVLMASLLFTAAKFDTYENKVITATNLKQATRSLSSYAMEGELLAQESAKGKTPENYQQAYGSTLVDQVKDVKTFLATHKVDSRAEAGSIKLQEQGDVLQLLLAKLGETSDPTELSALSEQLRAVSLELHEMGEDL